MQRRILFGLLLMLLSNRSATAQTVNAGMDTATCKGSGVMLMAKVMPASSNVCYSWKPDNGTLSCTDCPNPTATPMTTTTYTVTAVGEDFAFKAMDEIKVKVVEEVKFKEDMAMKYGFDNYGANAMEPWKSVEVGKTDPVTAEIKPANSFDGVYFKSSNTSNVTVSPMQATMANQTLILAGVANGETDIEAKCGGENGETTKTMHAKSYTQETKSLAVIQVNETNFASGDINGSALQSYLNNTIYNQAVFKWNVTKLPPKTITFDLNGNGKLDINGVLPMSTEQQEIVDQCDAVGYDKIIFLISNPSLPGISITGIMYFNQKYGFVCPSCSVDALQTVAHELGHGSWGLMHTPMDITNLMHNSAGSAKTKLRKDQWDQIQN